MFVTPVYELELFNHKAPAPTFVNPDELLIGPLNSTVCPTVAPIVVLLARETDPAIEQMALQLAANRAPIPATPLPLREIISGTLTAFGPSCSVAPFWTIVKLLTPVAPRELVLCISTMPD